VDYGGYIHDTVCAVCCLDVIRASVSPSSRKSRLLNHGFDFSGEQVCSDSCHKILSFPAWFNWLRYNVVANVSTERSKAQLGPTLPSEGRWRSVLSRWSRTRDSFIYDWPPAVTFQPIRFVPCFSFLVGAVKHSLHRID